MHPFTSVPALHKHMQDNQHIKGQTNLGQHKHDVDEEGEEEQDGQRPDGLDSGVSAA